MGGREGGERTLKTIQRRKKSERFEPEGEGACDKNSQILRE